jgi:hypothetical protein
VPRGRKCPEVPRAQRSQVPQVPRVPKCPEVPSAHRSQVPTGPKSPNAHERAQEPSLRAPNFQRAQEPSPRAPNFQRAQEPKSPSARESNAKEPNIYRSFYNSTSRGHALSKLVKTCSSSSSAREVFVVVCERKDVYASGCAIARVFPTFSRKTTSSDENSTVSSVNKTENPSSPYPRAKSHFET